jgi:hydrogenase 3 maturation protease
MHHPSWRHTLRCMLSQRNPDGRPPRVVVLGVGNDLNADDGAGVAVARAISPLLPAGAPWLALEGGSAPENTTGAIRRFRPDLVLMVDAVRMDADPGETRWVEWEDVDGFSASSHTLPLTILAAFLREETHSRVELLGIQAQTLDLGQPMSAPVQAAVCRVVDALEEAARQPAPAGAQGFEPRAQDLNAR